MYIPDAYRSDKSLSLIEEYPLAQLISVKNSEIYATAAPIVIDKEKSTSKKLVLIGHIARHNEHASQIEKGMPSLSIFNGPDAYISPNWYEEKKTVPTWNYQAVQVRGTIEVINDNARHIDILIKTITHVETHNKIPWTIEQAPEGKVESLLPHIISFEIIAEKVEAVSKLSQTHPPGDRQRIIDGLKSRGLYSDIKIADLMQNMKNNI